MESYSSRANDSSGIHPEFISGWVGADSMTATPKAWGMPPNNQNIKSQLKGRSKYFLHYRPKSIRNVRDNPETQ